MIELAIVVAIIGIQALCRVASSNDDAKFRSKAVLSLRSMLTCVEI